MEDPLREIGGVVRAFTVAESADAQRAALRKYATHDMEFQHPSCAIAKSPRSRDLILGVYQWYRVMSPELSVQVENVVFDEPTLTIFLDVIQTFHIRISPFKPIPSYLFVKIHLTKRHDLYYISSQENFIHPPDVVALLLPPLVPLFRLLLLVSALACNLFASIAAFLGFWSTKPHFHSGSHLYEEEEVKLCNSERKGDGSAGDGEEDLGMDVSSSTTSSFTGDETEVEDHCLDRAPDST